MNTRKLIAATLAAVALGTCGLAAAQPTLTIINTSPAREEHTGDPGASVYPWTNGVVGSGPGVPWQVRDAQNTVSEGWPSGPGMMLDPIYLPNWGTTGWLGAYLNLDAASQVRFEYMGKGDSSFLNTFEVYVGGVWTMLFNSDVVPCGASGAAPVAPTCTAGINEFTFGFPAGLLPFRYATGPGIILTNDGVSNPVDTLIGPGFFLGLDPYLATATHQNTGTTVYAALSDQLDVDDRDFQDLGVRISTVPEPGTIGLLCIALGALGVPGLRGRGMSRR